MAPWAELACHSLPSPKEKISVHSCPSPSPTTVVFIGQTSENKSTQEKSALKRDITFLWQEKERSTCKSKTKKEIYRCIHPCSVCSCPTVQNCKIKHDNTSLLFVISIFASHFPFTRTSVTLILHGFLNSHWEIFDTSTHPQTNVAVHLLLFHLFSCTQKKAWGGAGGGGRGWL